MMILLDTLRRQDVDASAKGDLAEMLEKILAVAMTFKEEVLYPAVRRVTADGAATLAIENHDRLKDLIAAVKTRAVELELTRGGAGLDELRVRLRESLEADDHLLDNLHPLLKADEIAHMGDEYLRRKTGG